MCKDIKVNEPSIQQSFPTSERDSGNSRLALKVSQAIEKSGGVSELGRILEEAGFPVE